MRQWKTQRIEDGDEKQHLFGDNWFMVFMSAEVIADKVALEAENQRLREALEKLIFKATGVVDWAYVRDAKNALAAPKEQP